MPRRTRRTPSQPQNNANHTETAFPDGTDVNTTVTTLQRAIAEDPTIGRELRNQPKGSKRTFSTQEATSTNPATHSTGRAPLAKRARATRSRGISDGREVTEHGKECEGESRHGPNRNDGIVETHQQAHQPLGRTSSFYPSRGGARDTLNPLSALVPASTPYVAEDNEISNPGESDIESENDWFDEQDLAAPRQASKFEEALTIERPVWQVSATTHHSTPNNSQTRAEHVDMPQAGSSLRSSVPSTPQSALSSDFIWTADTELVLAPGPKKKMRLSEQNHLIRRVIHEAMEGVRAELLFHAAYPDQRYIIVIIRTLLLDVTVRQPNASNIRRRLLFDDDYMGFFIPLIRARIPLYRSEVKDHCSDLISAEFSAINSVNEIQSIVEKQLSKYTYTYPTAPKNPNVVMRSRPYRNPRLATLISNLYFTGGCDSFAERFLAQFPTHEALDGVITREVPIPMVALVATGLFAALREWRTGTYQAEDFSANLCLDAYIGHVGSLARIEKEHNNIYHRVMGEIYTDARRATTLGRTQIGEIDLDELDD